MRARVQALPSSDPATDNPALTGWRTVKTRIDAAARAADRAPTDVTLVAVSKQQSWEAIEPVLRAGQRVFGENRVQESAQRWKGVREGVPDLELRLIGPLQSNKAEDAVLLFDVIETLDRPKILAALNAAIRKVGKSPRLYVQINTGEEPQKAGVAPLDADAFIASARGEHGLTIEGLMCIPPADEPPGPHFALLRKIADRNGLKCLSMGMSADFETAIRLGATSVRVGAAVFGQRH